ncbi:MAG: alpha-amylase, partial [Chloroflexi bacterium]|nr:alpha-amylase [Chloroflexota bacterium]
MNDSTNTPLMQDFIFGALEADENTLDAERRRWSGIRHQSDIDPLDPEPDQPVKLRVTVGRDVLIDHLTAYVTVDGREPEGGRGKAVQGIAINLQRTETRWQPLYWDYAEVWEGALPGQPEGSFVRYRIEGWHSKDASICHWSREMNIDGTADQPAIYGYAVDRFVAPAWSHEAIVYQIFVDRFAPAASGWLTPDKLVQFMGGNLQGIIAALDYLTELGVTAIWLSPIFLTNTYHAYDTIDFYEIDPRFGSKEDLRTLVERAHERGLRLILDFVANHTGDTFAPFRQGLADPDSRYRTWFSFGDEYKHGYRTFFTAKGMPQLNLDDPGARAYILDAARYWLREFEIDGYRLDYAAGPSHDFWSAFGAACKEENPDCWLFGEVTLGSDWLRTYAGRLDGCLDFSF